MSYAEVIRDAIDQATKAGAPGTAVLAHVEVGATVHEKFLTHVTEAPSGKRYGVLTLGAAKGWLESLGMRLATASDGRPLKTFTVHVDIRGTAVFDVQAYDADEAEEMAVELAQDEWVDLDYDAYSVASAVRKPGAA